MKTIVLPGRSASVLPIGFGCSSLASVGEKTALQLLGTAFDAGVRHFDVARYYGYGEAEGLLGKFLKNHRDEVTITTKFGIDPPRRMSGLRLAMQAGRQLVRLVPGARGILQRRAQGLVQRGGFSVADARRSLETSLRELGTNYIDFYLLHEYEPPEIAPDELVAFLQDRVKAGDIRFFGLATGVENTARILQSYPQLCDIAQFENSVLCRNLEKLPRAGRRPLLIFTHGALGASYKTIAAFFKTRSGLTKEWSTQLGLDCSREETISGLMLNYAIHANADGLVLFSSKSASRTKRNIQAVVEPEYSPAQVELFAQLVARDLIPANERV
jgi:D-threo-aldose 1-dehydrogenase